MAGKIIINGDENDNFLYADDNASILSGFGGNDDIQGGAGDDVELGGAGDDQILGGAADGGNDTVDGGAGDDYIRSSPGADQIDGGEGRDRVSYFYNGSMVRVNLSTGVADDGSGQNDALVNIEYLSGSEGYGDFIVGNAEDNTIYGNGGDDTLDGGAGIDTAGYGFSQNGAVTVNLATGRASGGNGNDVLSNFENITGSRYDDQLTGDAGVNQLSGSIGNDYILGGAGDDIELGGQGDDSMGGGDADSGNDRFDGGAGNDYMRTSPGADTLDGGGGEDRVSYYILNHAVSVNLQTGVADDGSGQNDTLISIERISGTEAYGDVIIGDAADNLFYGNGGDDTMDGGAGLDTAGYEFASAGVVVNLASGSSSGANGNDLLFNFENVEGSNFGDRLTGDAGANRLLGKAGDDTLTGGGGNDTLEGGSDRDVAVYSGLRTDYTISTDVNGGVIVSDRRDGAPDGTDLLHGIAALQFSDGTVELTALEHTVNSSTSGRQVLQVSAALNSGGYVTAYRDGDSDGDGISVRRFAADGSPLGVEQRVNTEQQGDQRGTAICALSDGGYVVVWNSNTRTGPAGNDANWEIKLQRFDASGEKYGDETTVNTTTAFSQRFASVAATSDGGFLVAWQSRHENDGNSFGGVYAQKFIASGAKQGGELHINTTTAGSQDMPIIRQVGVNDYVVMWRTFPSDGYLGYAQQHVDSNGAKLGGEEMIYSEPFVSGGTVGGFHLSATVSGGYVATWSSLPLNGVSVVMARAYGSDGKALGAAFVANTVPAQAAPAHYNSDVIGTSDGGFLLVWDSTFVDGSSAIVGRRYDSAGNAKTAEFVISDSSRAGWKMYPTLTSSGDGSIVVSWSGGGSSALVNGGGIFQQLIDENGRPEFVTASSSSALTEAPGFAVQTVVGGSQPVYDPAYASSAYYQLHPALSSGATVSNGHLALTGAAAFGSTIEIRSGDTVLARTGVDDDGRWGADLDNLGAGSYALQAVLTDVYGNQSAPGAVFHITIDNANIGGSGSGGADDAAYWYEHGANASDQLLRGGDGADTLVGGGGHDTMDGGLGSDVVQFSGNRADYRIATGSDYRVTVEDLRGGSPDGTVLLSGIEALEFADQRLDLQAQDHIVSSAPAGYQIYQSMASSWSMDGTYMIAFRASDGAGDGIFMRKFGADGLALGNDFAVNTVTAGDQRAPVVAALQGGGYAVAYHSTPVIAREVTADNPGNWDIQLQLFDRDGNKVGAEILVNTTTAYAQRLPQLTGLNDGGLLVTWQSSQEHDGADGGIFAQQFDAQGARVGGQFQVEANADGEQGSPSVSRLADGYVIAWQGPTGVDKSGYLQQQFDNNGNKVGAEQLVYEVASGEGAPSLGTLHQSALAGGGHVLSWAVGNGEAASIVMVRAYDAAGQALGDAVPVASANWVNSTNVLGLSNGNYMVVWDDEHQDGSASIMGVTIGAHDAPLSAPFSISQTAAFGVKLFPALAENASGQVAVSWGTQGGGALLGSGGIYQQLIDVYGNPEFVTASSSLSRPAATAITVQTVEGGASPVMHPDYPGMVYYLESAPLSSGSTVSNHHVVLSGTAAYGSSVIIKNGAATVATALADDSGRWAADLTELGNGSYALVATVRDIYGKLSDASAIFNLTVNTAVLNGTSGADGESYWLQGQGADASSQTLNGGNGNDTLNGGGGGDTLIGGSGDDSFIVNNGGVSVVELAGGGNDTVIATISTVLAANLENLVLNGESGLSGTGNALANQLRGGAGNDSLDGLGGADTLSGGGGDDLYTVDVAGDVVVEQFGAGNDSVNVAFTAAGAYTLAANVENARLVTAAQVNLTGNDLDNSLIGNAAVNILVGGAGADTLNGMGGNDVMTGGAGADVYYVDAAGDQVIEADGGGNDGVYGTLASYVLPANVEGYSYLGSGGVTASGNGLNNMMGGGGGADKLDGGAGNDTLSGLAGNDSLNGGQGDDVLSGGAGHDSLSGGDGNDRLVSDAARDDLSRRTGNDTIDGGGGDDLLQMSGNKADFSVSRLSATEIALFHAGRGETVTVRGVERIEFSDGVVSLESLFANAASPFDDVLTGTDGDDALNGLAGIDRMSGGKGDDSYTVDNPNDVVIELAGDEQGLDSVSVAFTAAGTYLLAANVENAMVTAPAIAVNLTGNELDNLLTGNAAANILIGGAGDDRLDGRAGNDQLKGGLGDDLYLVGDSGDVVTELVEQGADTVRTTLASYTLGANVEHLEYTGQAGLNGTGNALGNRITGGAGANRLAGGAGDDTLAGGAGNDSLQGGEGDDELSGNGGSDSVDGGAGFDVLHLAGNKDNYAVSRELAGEIRLIKAGGGESIAMRNVELVAFADGDMAVSALIENSVSPFDDFLTGSDQADNLNGLAGRDTMSGGLGDDVYTVDNPNDVLLEQNGLDGGKDRVDVAFTAAGTYLLGDSVENATVTSTGTFAVNLSGNDGDNVLTGNAGANLLLGGGGADTLIGGAGNDALKGGAGDDLYVVSETGDVVTELLNEGVDTVRTTLFSYTLGANVENLDYRGSAAFTATGNGLANEIIGGNAGNKIDGGGGGDTISGGNGVDSLSGGAGNDVIQASAGRDVIDGGADLDLLTGLASFASYTVSRPNALDTVLTDGHGVVLTVRNVESFDFDGERYTLDAVQDNIPSIGHDRLHGDDGGNAINGLAGNDTMTGGAGDDVYTVDNANDVVVELSGEGAGRDSVNVAFTAAGAYSLSDNVEDATVTSAGTLAVGINGNDGDNVLTGNGAVNTLSGGGGDDTLIGGAGNDILRGGYGDDVYLVSDSGDVVTELADQGVDTVRTALSSYTLGANVDHLDYRGNAAFTATGNALANEIIGGNAGNKIDGGGGDDTISGGNGVDSLSGGAGDDLINASAGRDVIDGGADFDLLAGLASFASYTVSRPNALDTVLTDGNGVVLTVRNVESFDFDGELYALDAVQDNIPSVGADHLHGDDGANAINGLAGNDTMTGGAGDDVYTVDNANDVVVEAAGEGAGRDSVNVAFTAAGVYALSANVENATVTSAGTLAVGITGNDGDNFLTGNGAANTLSGGAGNDTLAGGAGKDVLKGGGGDDVYMLADSGDTVTELPGEGTDTVRTTLASYTLGVNVENLQFTGSQAFTGTGNAQANVLQGGNGNDVLSGGGGNDRLQGGAGNDTLTGGTDADTFVLDSLSGVDTVKDFVSGVDKISLSMTSYGIGNGDQVLDGVAVRNGAGGFAAEAELLIFTQNSAALTTAAAAAIIGSASSAYQVGAKALFVIDSGAASGIYLFRAANADALVSAAELTQLATLTGNAATGTADYLFGA